MPPDIRVDPDSFNSHSFNLFDDGSSYTRNCGNSKKDSSVQFGNNVTLPKLRLPSLHTGSEIFFSVLFSTFLCIILCSLSIITNACHKLSGLMIMLISLFCGSRVYPICGIIISIPCAPHCDK